jgi:hypothetical protein
MWNKAVVGGQDVVKSESKPTCHLRKFAALAVGLTLGSKGI